MRVILLTFQRKYPQALTLLASIPDTPDNFSYGTSYNTRSKATEEGDLYRLMGDATDARRLYAQALPAVQAQLAVQNGHSLALVWINIADIELRLGHHARFTRRGPGAGHH